MGGYASVCVKSENFGKLQSRKYYLLSIVVIVFLCLYYFTIFQVLILGDDDYNIAVPGPKYPPTNGEVWPKPEYQLRKKDYYKLNMSLFKIEITKETCAILVRAIDRYKDIVNAIDQEISNGNDDELYRTLEELYVELTTPCDEYPHFDMDESYDLTIALLNSTLRCRSVWGCLRGLETFAQLIHYVDDSKALIIQATHIQDSPRYQHRGLLLDTSRHYITVTNIARTLDAMAINKMNVLHWHIVDDQSFPYQSERFPELSKQGAFHSSMLYKKEDIRKIVDYARDRGIRVVPEFDVPGHTRSWGNAYPKLLVECYKRSRVVGLGPINPINNYTYEFLRELFEEVQNWFPDKYFHIGGDEIILKCWQSNPALQAYMREHGVDVKGLHALFMKNAIPLLAEGSKVIVWQEVFDNGVPLDKDTLVQVWRYYWVEEMIKILQKGHKVLFSSAWYLDYLSVSWEELYAADPRAMIADVTSDPAVESIVGGEACMWGEMADDRNVISRVWPRTSAVAERLWSKSIERKPGDLTRRRLEEHTCRMIRRGIPAEPPSGPGFCVV